MKKGEIIVVAIVSLFLLACTGLLAPVFGLLVPVFVLAFGWIGFLATVLPRITYDSAALIQAIIVLAIVVGLAHYLLRWGFGHGRSGQQKEERAWRFRWTVMGVGVVILMFVVGISMIGMVHQVTWLVKSDEPIMTYGRPSYYRTEYNLREIGVAAQIHHDAKGRLPAGATFNEYGEMQHSWETQLLSMMEQGALYEEIDMELPWDHPKNAKVFESRIREFENPTLPTRPEKDANGFAVSHFSANSRVMGGRAPMRLEDISDGTANTILVGEVNHDFRPWGHPVNWRDPARGINVHGGFGGGPEQNSVLFLMADGSTRRIDKNISPEVLRALATPADGDDAADE